MHDRLNAVSADGLPDCCCVQDVTLHEVAVAHGGAVPRAEVVEDDRLVAAHSERLAGVAADIPGAARHEHAARLSAQWRNR
jgi:hypothetical protein